jgi:hypothetical protein
MPARKVYWNDEIETIPRERLRALQEEKLRVHLHRVCDENPYYREKFDAAGIKPADVRTLDDLRAAPFFITQELRDTQQESSERLRHPFGMHNIVDRGKILLVSATSGTTGVPTFAGLTRKDLEVSNECAAKTGKIDVISWPTATILRLMLNCQMPPTNEVKVRQAIKLAIDRPGIIEGILRGDAEEAKSGMAPFTWGYYPAAEVVYDPEKAKRLLTEAG